MVKGIYTHTHTHTHTHISNIFSRLFVSNEIFCETILKRDKNGVVLVKALVGGGPRAMYPESPPYSVVVLE